MAYVPSQQLRKLLGISSAYREILGYRRAYHANRMAALSPIGTVVCRKFRARSGFFGVTSGCADPFGPALGKYHPNRQQATSPIQFSGRRFPLARRGAADGLRTLSHPSTVYQLPSIGTRPPRPAPSQPTDNPIHCSARASFKNT